MENKKKLVLSIWNKRLYASDLREGLEREDVTEKDEEGDRAALIDSKAKHVGEKERSTLVRAL